MTRLNERIVDSALFSRRKATADTKRKIAGWKLWECDDRLFSHDYDRTVSFFVHEGQATLTFATGEILDVQPDDVVTIHNGASATWAITKPIRNSYCYHDTFESAAKRHEQVYWNDQSGG